MKRGIAALSALSLIGAAPPPAPGAAPQSPPSERSSAVRCRDDAPLRPVYHPPVPQAGVATDQIVVTGRKVAPAPNGAVPPPPPPPAPPPPPPASVTVSGTRTNGIVSNYAPPYGAAGNRERYAGAPVAAIQQVAEAPVSTFAIDVDTGAYANARRFLNQGQVPPVEAVRTEEFINYFRYDYPRPKSAATPFSVTTDVARTPWNPATRLLRIGLRGYDTSDATRPPANLVFLVDVSGSMMTADKLPLVKQALTTLADRLTPRDRVSIVVYASQEGLVLEPTADKQAVKAALSCLEAGGSTAGGAGLKLAYQTARANFVKGGINRIFLATDGDFNVGLSDNKAIEALVKAQREDGITLTTLGFGRGNYNEAMMERIADVGNGNYAYIDSADEARKVLDQELSATLVTIAKDVKVQVEFNPAQVSQYRLIGYENRALAEQDFKNDAVDAGDMGAGHQVTALYEIVPAGAEGWLPPRRYAANRPPEPRGRGSELCQVRLRFKAPDGAVSREITHNVPAALARSAVAPRGDMAFAVAVAAFGQKLRGDTLLGGYGYQQIAALAGDSGDEWRRGFVAMVGKADALRPAKGAAGE